jgi:prepilin-type processing-associated H-X9-DG protein
VGRRRYLRGLLDPEEFVPDVLLSPIYCINQAPNPPCTAATTALPEMYAARSRHPGSVNVAMADGSVRFVKDTVNLQLWRMMSTAAGGELFCGGGDPY